MSDDILAAATKAAREHFGDSYIPHGSMEDGFIDGSS